MACTTCRRIPAIASAVLLLAMPWLVDADVPDPRIEKAAQLYREAGAAQALPVFEQLANEFARSKRTRDQAAALHYLGECHWRAGNFAEARTHLARALALERAASDRSGEARTLNVLGLLSWDEGRYALAADDLRKSAAIARALGDRKLEGSALNNLSLVYDEQGDYDTSLRQYRQVIELYRGANFPRGVGDTLGNIGGVYLLLGQFRQALDYYQQALAISEQLKSVAAMSQDHGNIGHCLLGMGDVDAALVHLDQAIALATRAGMKQDEAYWKRVRANALVTQGRYDLALESYRAALATYASISASAELPEALHDYGELELLVGDAAAAERDFKRALELSRAIGLERSVTLNLVALGDVESRRGRPDAAAALYEQARKRAAAAGEQHSLAQSLLRLADVHRAQQRLAPAAGETAQALEIARRIDARGLEAEALLSRAELARLARQFDSALQHYASAERANASAGDPDIGWRILFGRGRAQEAAGDVQGAIASLQAAVVLIEGVRGRLQEPRFRSGYVEDKFEVYRKLMQLQLRVGRIADAFGTAERLRARSFVEQLEGRATVPLSASERRAEAELRERVRQLQRALADEAEDGSPSYPARATRRFSQELLLAEKQYEAFLDDQSRVHPAAVATVDAARVQRQLGEGEALLEYVTGPEGIVIFVLTPQRIRARTAEVPERDLAARIDLLRDLIRRPDDDRWRKPAARLSAELLHPLERAGWLDGVSHLYIVPHGTLTYLPFAVLPESAARPADLLVDHYTVAYLPAGSALLRTPDPAKARRSMLALAPGRGGLRYAPDEARAIDALFRPSGLTFIGAEATESRFKRLAGDFRLLHLATHGYFNRSSPLLSGLELEPDGIDDGMLRVHEILDLQLHADLVTLSACDTALGSGYLTDLPVGDDFLGLNRAFLAAGSESVVATLWPVDDRASVYLMKLFYGRLGDGSGRSPDAARALALAQRSLRRSAGMGHPYYWAAHVVVGRIDPAAAPAASSTGRST